MRVGCAIALAALLSGCSFVFMKPVPATVPPGAYVSCDEGTGYPIADAIIAALQLAVSVDLLIRGEDAFGDTSDDDEGRMGGAIGGMVIGAAFVGSAYYGFRTSKRCRDAHAAFERERLPGLNAAPPPVYEGTPATGGPGRMFPGREANVCRADGTCEPGLVCASNICVVPPSRRHP